MSDWNVEDVWMWSNFIDYIHFLVFFWIVAAFVTFLFANSSKCASGLLRPPGKSVKFRFVLCHFGFNLAGNGVDVGHAPAVQELYQTIHQRNVDFYGFRVAGG